MGMPALCEITVAGLEAALERVYDDVVSSGSLLHGFVDGTYACWLLRSGGVEVRHARGKLVAGAGQWVLLPAWLRRDQRFQPGTRLLSVRFACRHASAGPPFAADLPRVAAASAMPGMAEAGEALAALGPPAASGDDLPTACRRQAGLLGFIAAWHAGCVAIGCRPPGAAPVDPRLAAARAVLDAHGRIRPVPYDQLERAARLSRPQLDRLFPTVYGLSPAAWLDRRAVERATALLADRALPIKAIAHRLGFVDDAHFARWFRRQTGGAPSDSRGGAV